MNCSKDGHPDRLFEAPHGDLNILIVIGRDPGDSPVPGRDKPEETVFYEKIQPVFAEMTNLLIQQSFVGAEDDKRDELVERVIRFFKKAPGLFNDMLLSRQIGDLGRWMDI